MASLPYDTHGCRVGEVVSRIEAYEGLQLKLGEKYNDSGHVEASTLEAEARDLNSKADAIESAVYNLKAVDPNTRSDEDIRTPEALIAFIEPKGRQVTQALAALQGEQQAAWRYIAVLVLARALIGLLPCLLIDLAP
jgi:DNA repair ATPase RecN